jgi:N utilization substance protein B
VKVLQVLYAYYKNDDRSLARAEKELFFSIGKSYDLYHLFLLLIVDVAHMAEQKIDAARNKLVPSREDLNPNTRFIDNQLIRQLAENSQLLAYASSNTISWDDHPEFVKRTFDNLVNSELYHDYMHAEETSYEKDQKFVVKFFSHLLAADEELYSLLEEKSIYWNDDVEFMLSMVMKTIKKFKKGDNEYASLLPLFKDSEDEEFAKKLFRKSIILHEEHQELIKGYTKNWDVDRIAYMDVLILEVALSEIVEFTNIPVKVSFNEYLEIAKYYSTKNSSNFINGILDKIVAKYRQEDKLKKAGRGLMGEVK